jgi:hypothetical protein
MCPHLCILCEAIYQLTTFASFAKLVETLQSESEYCKTRGVSEHALASIGEQGLNLHSRQDVARPSHIISTTFRGEDNVRIVP